MRTPMRTVIALLAIGLAGCSSGGGVTVVRQPPRPMPVPIIVEPLEVDVARPHNGKIYVQTNRPAYVAIFDIMPERGVAIVYPGSARQRRFVVSGLRELPVWWERSHVTYHAPGPRSSRAQPERYIYVLASDEPLRLSDDAFRDDYLYRVLGGRGYRASNPYATMRALARHFVPSVAEEQWAEDAYVLSRSYASERYRVTRVYCRDGYVYEVPAELADRVWCGTYPRAVGNGSGRVGDVELTSSRRAPVRPDSVVGDHGRRVATRTRGANGRGPIDRVKEPPGRETPVNGGDEKEKEDRPSNSHGNGRPEARAEGRPGHPEDRSNDRPDHRAGQAPQREPGTEMRNRDTTRERPEPAPESAEKSQREEKVHKADRPEPESEKVDHQDERPAKVHGKAEPKADAKEEAKADAKADTKSHTPSEKRAEPEKSRSLPDSSDQGPSNRKSKKSGEPKPLT